MLECYQFPLGLDNGAENLEIVKSPACKDTHAMANYEDLNPTPSKSGLQDERGKAMERPSTPRSREYRKLSQTMEYCEVRDIPVQNKSYRRVVPILWFDYHHKTGTVYEFTACNSMKDPPDGPNWT
jgi:hypothetical protein